jgi:hypothetical protein
MIIDDKKRFVYIAVPKTASKSMSIFLGQTYHPAPLLYHKGIRDITKERPEIRDFFTFGFTRNPFSRLVSIYNDFTKYRIYQYSELDKRDRPLLGEFKNFEDFAINLKDSPWHNDIFFRPQYEFVTYEDGTPISFIGKFENLNKDFAKVCDRLNIRSRNLPHFNQGVCDTNKYRDYYSEKSKLAVEELYQKDIEMFNYSF